MVTWATLSPNDVMKTMCEEIADRLGVTPAAAAGIYYAELDARNQRRCRCWVVADEALVIVDVIPGDAAAAAIDGQRYEWPDAPSLTARTSTTHDGFGWDHGVSYEIAGQPLLNETNSREEEKIGAFAREYWKRWPSRR